MVTRGQLLERPVVIPVGDLCLDGIYLRGEAPGLLIASPLALRGGSMANPVGSELAYAAAYVGSASLRLDYRGVGASEGEPSAELAEAVADLREGAAFLTESIGEERIVLVGVHSGVWPALAMAQADERVEALLLVCPDREPPPGAPGLVDIERPTVLVEAENDPTFDRAAVTEHIDACSHVRLHVFPRTSRHFREGLAQLSALVPPLLGKSRRE